MEGTNVEYSISINGAEAEAQMDRLIAKAEKLKAILTDCGVSQQVLDNSHVIPSDTLTTAGPNIVYTIALGDIKTLAQAPADAFAPEFLTELEKTLPHIFNPRTKEPGKAKLELDLTNSGNYKKPVGEA